MILYTFTIHLLLIVVAQTSTPSNSTLQLDRSYSLQLDPNQPTTWQIFIGDTLPNNSDLFVNVQAPPNSPLQQPFVSIKIGQNSTKLCDAVNNQFSGICRVDKSELIPKQNISVVIQCLVRCRLIVTAAISPRLRLQLNTNLIVRAPKDTSAQFQFEAEVPQGANFTELALYAQILDYPASGAGMQLLANTGDLSMQLPTSSNYQMAGQSIFWGGKGLYFNIKDFQQGHNWIKVFLSLSSGMKVKLSFDATNGNDFIIKLGEAYFDFTTQNQPKMYYLDLANNLEGIRGKTLLLGIIVYAGTPTIRVSMESNFSKVLNGQNSFGTISYLLTQSLRNSSGFSNVVYISISSGWNADFYIYTQVSDERFLKVSPNIAYYNELYKGEVFNYFFDETFSVEINKVSPNTTRKYVIRVDMMRGQGTYGIRRCRSIQRGDTETSCLITSADVLTDSNLLADFQEITVAMKKTNNYYMLTFQYDLSTCKAMSSNSSSIKTYYCSFHALGANTQDTQLDYTWKISRRSYAGMLQEGQVIRQAIFEGEFLYYRFGLSSFDNVEEVVFFVTVTEGNIFMLGSTADPYPNFNSDRLKTSGSDRLVFLKSELTHDIYISATALQFSEFTIGVVVSRRETASNNSNHTTPTNHTQSSKIELQLGVTQEYTLKKPNDEAVFSIRALENQTVVIEVVELVGSVSMDVLASGSPAKCHNKSVGSTSVECTLEMKKGEMVEVRIGGEEGVKHRFTISYRKESGCTPYSLNLPLFKEMLAGAKDCVLFSINKLVELQLTTAISIDQLINSKLEVQVCINGECLDKVVSHHEFIQSQLLSVMCQLKGKHTTACDIQINLANHAPNSLYFTFILQQRGTHIALFDGIAQKVSAPELSLTEGQKFYFEVFSSITIRIFFTSFTSGSLIVLAHFVEEKDFLSQPSAAYMSSDKQQQANSTNFFEFKRRGAGSNLFAISPERIQQNCKKCVLTISVYASLNSVPYSNFQIEVSQQETAIAVGQAKIGFIEQNDIFIYQLDQPTTSDALVSVRDLEKESSRQPNCFRMGLTDQSGGRIDSSSNQLLLIPVNSTKLSLFITAIAPLCSFEINYASAYSSITRVHQNQLYSFKLEKEPNAYFFYQHPDDKPFKIVQILSSGASKIGASPVSAENNLKALVGHGSSNFPFSSDQSTDELLVTSNSSFFCTACSYLIAVTSVSGAKGQIFIAALDASVPLSINGIIKETIKVSQSRQRTYTFNSLVGFNVSVNLIYGRLKVAIREPNGRVVLQKAINSSTTLYVNHSKSSEHYTYEYNSHLTTFSITVEAEIDSSFTLKASKIHITKRIFEGVSTSFEVVRDKSVVLQFLNLELPSTSGLTKTINLLFEVVQMLDQSKVKPEIAIEVAVRPDESKSLEELQTIRVDSATTINIEMPYLKGDYFINVTSSADTYLSSVLAKESLIHLQPEQIMLISRQHTFQLYSPQKSILLQIFACSGEIAVEAADSYNAFSSNKAYNQVVLEQKNYGGHFVISSENVFGEYFLRVNQQPSSQVDLYQVYYHYYDHHQPYRMVELHSPQITYSLQSTTITFHIQTPTINITSNSNVRAMTVNYQFYLSEDRNNVSTFANCRFGGVTTHLPTSSSKEQVTFTLNSGQLGNQQPVYFLGAQALIKVTLKDASASPHYPSELRLIYDTIQVTNPQLPHSDGSDDTYSVQQVVVFMLLPFGVAGLALFVALRFCIKKYKGMIPDNFNQQNPGESAESVQANSGNIHGKYDV